MPQIPQIKSKRFCICVHLRDLRHLRSHFICVHQCQSVVKKKGPDNWMSGPRGSTMVLSSYDAASPSPDALPSSFPTGSSEGGGVAGASSAGSSSKSKVVLTAV